MIVNNKVVVKKTVNARIEDVFDAWANPKKMNQWFFPKAGWQAQAGNEFKVGGTYSLEMIKDEGSKFVQKGEYKEIIPNQKIVFTWCAGACEDGVVKEPNSTVTVELEEIEGGTELTLTHELIPTEELRQEHEQGWQGCLGNLSLFFPKAHAV